MAVIGYLPMMDKLEFHLLLFWSYVCLEFLNKENRERYHLGYSCVQIALEGKDQEAWCTKELTCALEMESCVAAEQREGDRFRVHFVVEANTTHRWMSGVRKHEKPMITLQFLASKNWLH